MTVKVNGQELEQILNKMVALWRALVRCEVGDQLVHRVPTEDERRRWRSGMPWLALVPPETSEESFSLLIDCVTATAKKVFPELSPDLSRASDSLNGGTPVQEAFNRLRERVLKHDGNTHGNTQRTGFSGTVSPELQGFLAGAALKLFMWEYGKEAAGWCSVADWQRGICPVCGNYPSFSLLRDEERTRYLYCDLCGTNWRFSRIGCPFCEFSHGEQTLFVLEGHPEYRIYVCDACRGYLKTVDAKLRQPDNLLLENIRTSFIDLLLLREGYHNPAVDGGNLTALAEGGKHPLLQD
ncbi:MAG: formate dehydrogenase accessory protein FdhE [Bacillota bacterium]